MFPPKKKPQLVVKIDQNVTIIYLCARWHDKIDALILTPYSRKRSHSSLKIGHLPHTYLSETGALVPTLQRSIENLPAKWTKQPAGFNLLKVP